MPKGWKPDKKDCNTTITFYATKKNRYLIK